jgi:hypothetical protein
MTTKAVAQMSTAKIFNLAQMSAAQINSPPNVAQQTKCQEVNYCNWYQYFSNESNSTEEDNCPTEKEGTVISAEEF